jgi:hypothetical protein
MATITKKELRERCGNLTAGNLSNYIKRGKIVLNSNGDIDLNNDVNRLFLQKNMVSQDAEDDTEAKKKTPKERIIDNNIKKEKASKQPAVQLVLGDGENDEVLDKLGVPTITYSERVLKYRDTQKRQKEIERLELDLQKKRGEVIPTELILPVFKQHNHSLSTQFHNGAEEFLRRIAKIKDLSSTEVAKLKGELVAIINEAQRKSAEMTIHGVDAIIKEFSVKKGVGEREQ